VELQNGISASVFVDVDGNATSTTTVPWVLRSTTDSVDLSVETLDESFVLDAGDHDISFYAREAGTRLVAVGIQPHVACRWVPPEAEQEEGMATLASEAVTLRGNVTVTTEGDLDVVYVTAETGADNCGDDDCTYPASVETMLAYSIYCWEDVSLQVSSVKLSPPRFFETRREERRELLSCGDCSERSVWDAEECVARGVELGLGCSYTLCTRRRRRRRRLSPRTRA